MCRTASLFVLFCVACADLGETRGTISMTDRVGAAAGGTGTLQGSIHLPAPLGGDKRITLTLIAQGYSTSRSDEVTNGDVMGFLIQGVPDGIYIVGAAVDRDEDGKLGEEDWAGFAGGTTEHPVLRRGSARQVNVVNGVGQIDIAVGTVGSCLLPLGSACVSDSDCRYMACACPAVPETGTAARTVFYLPTCAAVSRVCQLDGPQTCDAVCTPAPELAVGPCLRDLDLTTAQAD